ncbi:MAG: NAD(P)-binding protein [Planctomycetaceae bacterium]|nr:NAD(P)-binding protein [Planctomycetales bacterium]MCB9938333.1 NAD(P)-binding protein [Planctomycetaceae bacterium]
MTRSKRRIAVLGGGVGALSAVWGLTNDPDFDSKYDVTVYQLGWRLGGKGASGRNASVGERIEEHGLHVWGGYYENAFRMMADCYRTLGADWKQWFERQDQIVLEERLGSRWSHWRVPFPPKSSEPGTAAVIGDVWQDLRRVLEWQEVSTTNAKFRTDVSTDTAIGWLREARNSVPEQANYQSYSPTAQSVELLVDRLQKYQDWLDAIDAHQFLNNQTLRRLWISLVLSTIQLKGFISDRVYERGFSSIDHLDYRDWLKRHGAREVIYDCAWIYGVYDYLFAYEGGDPKRGRLAAGVALCCVIRLMLCYKGAVMWKMKSGMGDAIFTPIYQMLANRGVKFEFFHRVDELQLSHDHQYVERIRLWRQVELKSSPYAPLRKVQTQSGETHDCWPNEPLYDQIRDDQADKLQSLKKQHDIDLESHWIDWHGEESERVLERGAEGDEGFDDVVLGISVGALPSICHELADHNTGWKLMLDGVKTVQTQSLQLWTRSTLQELGWRLGPFIFVGYEPPFPSGADMNQTLPAENWSDAIKPRAVTYYCAAMPDALLIPTSASNGFPVTQAQQVLDNSRSWIDDHIKHLLPQFDWAELVDPSQATGVARLNAQYWRANINPSDRYVQSLPKSTAVRLASNGSGYRNLHLAGDWVKTSMNFGCVESAVIAGLQAARTISGHPQRIPGERDFE